MGRSPFRVIRGFHVASLYPTLDRLEDKGLIEGRWVERAGSGGAATTGSRRIRAAFDAGERPDEDVIDELADHAAAAYQAASAEGAKPAKAPRVMRG